MEDVAATLGLSRSTVFGWVAKYREGGRAALAARPMPGRPPRPVYLIVDGHSTHRSRAVKQPEQLPDQRIGVTFETSDEPASQEPVKGHT